MEMNSSSRDTFPPSRSFASQTFIATPTCSIKRYCAPEFSDCVVRWGAECMRYLACNSRGSSLPYYRADAFTSMRHLKLDDSYYNQKDSIHKRITRTANWLRDRFLETDCNYYLSLESDVMLQAETLDMLEAFVESHPEFGMYHTNCYTGFHPEYKQNPIEVNRATVGCTLIKREVLEKISFRYEPTLLAAHYDAILVGDVMKQGYKIGYDASIVLPHRENATSGGRGWDQLPLKERL